MKSKYINYIKAAVLTSVLPVAVAQAAPDPNFHIYLLLGQSNMQGAAHQPAQPYTHPRVRVLQSENCSGISTPYGQWRDHFHPVIRCATDLRFNKHTGRDEPIGLGPGDSFAVEMAEAAGPEVTIGLVGAAFGGTDIEYHVKNCSQYGACAAPYGQISGAPGNGNNGAYVWALDLARKAQEVGVIKGFILHHGENNAGEASWLARVKEYVTDLRNDLGLDPAETPFIAGELPRTGCCASSHNPIVQRVDDAPSAGGIENGHWVSSGPMEDGTILDDRGDDLHWSTDSVIEMGKRYAAKMLEKGIYGPVNCGEDNGTPICCSMDADPDGDGIGEQNEGQQCVITDQTPGWHPPNPADVVAAINVGGSGDAMAFGDIWFAADNYVSGGQSNDTDDAISGADGSAVYQTERFGDFTYEIPVQNGDYTVQLGMVELYHNNPGSRSFNVVVEGQQRISGLDIYEQVGHDALLLSEEFPATVSDGVLDIGVSTVTDNGTLSSIVVRKVGEVSSSSQATSSSSSSSSSSLSSSSVSSSSSSQSGTTTGGAFTGLFLWMLGGVLLIVRLRP